MRSGGRRGLVVLKLGGSGKGQSQVAFATRVQYGHRDHVSPFVLRNPGRMASA